jgi:RNA-binding protein 26
VLALLKKDKPVKELQQCMAEQLDVFLGAETEPFVDRLFVVIKTEEYKTAADTLAEAAEPDPSKVEGGADKSPGVVTMKPVKECTPPLFDATSTKAKDSAENRNGDSDVLTPTASSVTTNSSSGSAGGGGVTLISPIIAPHSKSGQESGITSGHGKYSSNRDDNHARESRRRRGSNHRSRSPRSRSRSYDRSRRSRSRDRRPLESGRANLRSNNYNNNNNNNNHRNKSPIVLGGGRNRYDRPKNERIGYGARHANRNRSPTPTRSLSPSPDLPTPSSRRKERSLSPNATTAAMDLEPPKKRQRCRDFDEKGYCMRGETCEWDHGVDPVVLEDINNPALLSIQSGAGGGPMGRGAGGQLHGEYNPDAPDLWNRSGVNYLANRGPLAGRLGGVAAGNNGPQSVGVFPRAPLGFRGPTVGGATGFPFPANPTATPLQRELIPVPVLEGGQGGEMTPQQQHLQMMKKRYEPEDSVAIAEGGHQPPMMNMNMNMGGGGHKRKLPMNSRLGPRMGGPPGGQQQNCSLELRKIPRGLNAIAHLNNHFSKFGKIVNIQISYEGDPEAAIITFSTHAEANVAYRSTEAVLNNRFIKVFWHSTNSAAQAPPESNLTASGLTKSENKMSLRRQHPPSQPVGVAAPPVPAATDASGQPVAAATTGTPGSATVTTATTTTTPASATVAAALKTSASNAAIISANHLRLKNQRINRAATEIIRKKQEEQVKTAVQLAHGLHKRKHDLLQEYLKQMRSLVELVERTDHADPQRPPLLTTIKDLQTSIDKLKKEIEQEQAKISAQAQNQPPQRKTKEQQQKELLDVELELITQEHVSFQEFFS